MLLFGPLLDELYEAFFASNSHAHEQPILVNRVLNVMSCWVQSVQP